MTDFSPYLLVSDYDRTMTDFSGAVPAANLEAVDRFIAGGGAFTIATGRSLPMFAHRLRELRVNAPVILFNGAAVWRPEDGAIDVRFRLPDGWFDAVRDLHGRFPWMRLEMQGLRRHACVGPDPLREAHLEKNGVPHTEGSWELDDTVLGVCLYAPFRKVGHIRPDEAQEGDAAPFDELEAIVAERYGALFHTMRSMPRMLELIPQGCGKGLTARALARELGRPRLLCAGDAPNDLHMLYEADEAFIPVSADPAIQGLGFQEAAHCDEGTIASIVDMLAARA